MGQRYFEKYFCLCYFNKMITEAGNAKLKKLQESSFYRVAILNDKFGKEYS